MTRRAAGPVQPKADAHARILFQVSGNERRSHATVPFSVFKGLSLLKKIQWFGIVIDTSVDF